MLFGKYFLLLAGVFVFVFLTQYVSAIPSGAIPSMGIELNKIVYTPNENVIMHIWGGGSLSGINGTIYLKILDATNDIRGSDTVFGGNQNLVNGELHFNYTISNTTEYRYLVQIYQNQTDCCPLNSAYFVTKNGAEKILINNVTFTPKVIPSGTINFTADVTDGLGNELSTLSVRGDLPDSQGTADYLVTDAVYNNSTKSFSGSISVPASWEQYTNQLKQYHLRISAHGLTDKGLTPSEYQAGMVNVVSSVVPEFTFTMPILVVGIVVVFITFYKFGSTLKIR